MLGETQQPLNRRSLGREGSLGLPASRVVLMPSRFIPRPY
jgi:hypothetical protein